MLGDEQFRLTVAKLAKAYKGRSKAARLEASILEQSLMVQLGQTGKSVQTKQAPAKTEEDAEFDRLEQSLGPKPKNVKSEEDRAWLLKTVLEAQDNPANWNANGELVVKVLKSRDFGDNLVGYLQKNGCKVGDMSLSPIMDQSVGADIGAWNLILTR